MAAFCIETYILYLILSGNYFQNCQKNENCEKIVGNFFWTGIELRISKRYDYGGKFYWRKTQIEITIEFCYKRIIW